MSPDARAAGDAATGSAGAGLAAGGTAAARAACGAAGAVGGAASPAFGARITACEMSPWLSHDITAPGAAGAAGGAGALMVVGGMKGRFRSDAWSGIAGATARGALPSARSGSASGAMFGSAAGASSSEFASGLLPVAGPRPNSWSSELGSATGTPRFGPSGADGAPPMSRPSRWPPGAPGGGAGATASGANGSQSVGMPPGAAACAGAGAGAGQPAGDALPRAGRADRLVSTASGSISSPPDDGVAADGPSRSANGSAALDAVAAADAATASS